MEPNHLCFLPSRKERVSRNGLHKAVVFDGGQEKVNELVKVQGYIAEQVLCKSN